MPVGKGCVMVLGVTDTLKPNLQFYINWIRKAIADVDIVTLSSVQQNLSDLDGCDGLVLTGGSDVHPRFYGCADAIALLQGVNEVRDEFEFALISRALEVKLPILGICRGMQVFNVALGGSLILDVELAGYLNHRKDRNTGVDQRHALKVTVGTQLHSIASAAEGEVNTNHHQAVDRIAQDLRPTAWSPDGLVEGMEWKSAGERPFLQLVQWHPERMDDFENPLSKELIERFAKEVRASKQLEILL
ncbi:MAG TPA: peptidase C26 [Bacteroidetes bacterium]|jgi:putative glutamine amidotransferase|nr:peptidase C26 [Bacteroidota bacterium]